VTTTPTSHRHPTGHHQYTEAHTRNVRVSSTVAWVIFKPVFWTRTALRMGMQAAAFVHAVRLPCLRGPRGPPSVPQCHLRYTRAIWARTVSALQNLAPNYDTWSATTFDPTFSGYFFPLADSSRVSEDLSCSCSVVSDFENFLPD